jgi:hypothetical protein
MAHQPIRADNLDPETAAGRAGLHAGGGDRNNYATQHPAATGPRVEPEDLEDATGHRRQDPFCRLPGGVATRAAETSRC